MFSPKLPIPFKFNLNIINNTCPIRFNKIIFLKIESEPDINILCKTPIA